ncbi:hypothetical protein HVTV-2_gp1 [Haloarcula virus HVTV-2]|uniref:Uncharacterized protein n=1 Tax=Haloarcula vallismortis tailed virus 1 TaxID=1262528 RepID=L7TJ04_9CAUD|nr:hypothetical protein HVTV1_1 [Haloarcula vallismortis tailed virus 1]AGC34373.1 hypothetical protein HVTV1_1 [Haloarcula vallismortis tailed virus 1]UBF22808.1 hypothetical protein HVTV-2_gp1 [Haloarcula virus HVTV-2]
MDPSIPKSPRTGYLDILVFRMRPNLRIDPTVCRKPDSTTPPSLALVSRGGPLDSTYCETFFLRPPVSLRMGQFPHDDEPDGDRLAPHHFLQGSWAFGLLSINLHTPALLVPIAVALFGWYHAWYIYPRLGASLVLVGLCASLVALTMTASVGIIGTILLLICLAVAFDDAVSHAFGVWTPLDWTWKTYLHDLLTG